MLKKLNRIIISLISIVAFGSIVSIILMEFKVINPKYVIPIVVFGLSDIIILVIIKVIIRVLNVQKIKYYENLFPYNKEIEVTINRKKMKESENSLCYEEKRILRLSEDENYRFYLVRHLSGWTQDTISIKCKVNGEEKDEQQVYYESEPYAWVEYLEKEYYVK